MNEISKKCQSCNQTFTNLDNYIDKTDPLYFRLYGWKKEYHKTCWEEIERQQAENKKKCQERQAEIIADFLAKGMNLEQQAQMAAEGEMLHPEAYSYPHESQTNLVDWEDHVKTLDKTKPELIIEPNKYRFKDDKPKKSLLK